MRRFFFSCSVEKIDGTHKAQQLEAGNGRRRDRSRVGAGRAHGLRVELSV